MTRQVLDLGQEVGLAYLDDLFGKLSARRDEGAAVPGIEQIRADLRAAAGRGAIHARVVRSQSGSRYLRLYVDGRYALNMDPSGNGRGYLIRDVRPLRLDDHDQIVQAGFALKAARWTVYGHPGEFPVHLAASWDQVKQAWQDRPQAAAGGAGPGGLSAEHARYLDELELVVRKARDLEVPGRAAARVGRYKSLEPAPAVRRSARSIHKFRVMGESRLSSGARVVVAGHLALRGEVRDVRESLLTVHFDAPVDFDSIPPMGDFVALPDTTTLDKQAEAIDIIRDGRSKNPCLLDVLVAASFRPYQPAQGVKPAEQLDPSQLRAFKMALRVPDLGLVQGPPGTGKTRTVRQVIRYCSAARKTVLVSAHTNQAVDNVLKDLPDDLTVLRVGGGVTEACAHLTLEAQAARLQRRILDRTEPVLRRYSAVDPDTGQEAVQRLRELATGRSRLAAVQERVRDLASRLSEVENGVTGPLRTRLAELTETVGQREATARERDERLSAISARRARAAQRATTWIGRLFQGQQERLEQELAAATAVADAAHRDAEKARRDRAGAQAALARLRDGHPALTELGDDLKAARAELPGQAGWAAQAARRLVRGLPDPSDLPPIEPDLAALTRFQTAAEEAISVAQRRLRLLTDWRDRLGRRTEQLNPELVRYADVIGATCTGAARAELAGIDFELAIIDEAGQITTPSLIVPLVRARRAVLIGDHVQLPPYCDEALKKWAEAEDTSRADLVTKSTFELLFPRVPDSNKRMLEYQRRMPEVVADFISGQFYSGGLRTAVRRPLRDELFASAMAFVDTSELATGKRRERRPRADEPWRQESHINEAEAQIITDLAAYYHARHDDWVVIVPFSAQEGRITELLADRLGNEELAASRVASVDSFQGGERDTVIFGFTRSNRGGKVGFFRDVRRCNVAFSRARYRLIMVGDLNMLRQAADVGFRDMSEALEAYLRRRGDIRGYREVRALVQAETGQ